MMRTIVLSLLLTSVAHAADPLSLEAALKLAMEHQPALAQARANAEAAEARVISARAPLLPQVNGSLGYSRTTSNFAPQPGAVPNNLAASTFSLATSDFFSSSLRVNQLVYDFGSSWGRFRSAEAGARAQRFSENASVQSTLYAVRLAYFQAQATHALLAVAQQTLHTQELHLAQVQGFVDVGTRPAIDLAKSRTDKANARLQLINAQADEATAKAQLNDAMGLEQGLDYAVSDSEFPQVDQEDTGLEPLLKEALDARPEFGALQQQLTAQELTVSSVNGGYWPSIGVSTGLTGNGRALDQLGVNWSAGLSVNWALFQGLQTNAQVQEAEANVRGLQAQLANLRQQVRLEVETARLQLASAKEALSAAGEVVQAASEGLKLAEGRYETGVGTQLERSDAQLQVTLAASQVVRAKQNLAVSRAALLKALGRDVR